MKTSIAIIIPTHNRAHLLERAIASVYHSQFTQIIVVNDNSDQENTNYIETVIIPKFPKIYYHKNVVTMGAPETVNIGIKLSTSEWFTILEDDDFYVRDIFPDILDFISTNQNADIIHHTIETKELDGSLSMWGAINVLQIKIKENNQIPVCCIVKKRVWSQLKGFRKIPFHDWDFWIRAIDKKFIFAYFPLVFYYKEMQISDSLLVSDLKKITLEEWKRRYIK